MTYHFRWVPEGTTFNPAVHVGMDEDIFEYLLEQKEGNFAALTLVISNPGIGPLHPSREQWAFFSETIEGVNTLRFYGRLIAIPEGLQHEELIIKLVAQPADFEDQRAALVADLKGDPEFWDPVFVDPASLNDPDAVMLARTQAIHSDPVTHVLSVSDKIAGEDGLLTFDADEVFYDPVDLTYSAAPARRFEMGAEIRYTQRAVGTVDISANLIQAFRLAGTTQPFMISSYTASGLVEDWPLPGDDIGRGWKVSDSNVEDGGGRWVSETIEIENRMTVWAPDFFGTTITSGLSVAVDIGLGIIRPTLIVGYDVARSYVEKVNFTLEADVQAVRTEAGEGEVIRLSLASNDVSEPVDPEDTDSEGVPIADVRRRSYMLTERGKRSARYLVARARASLIDRARCVQIPLEVDFSRRTDVSLRKSGIISDPRLPGGAAQGKLIAIREVGNGDTGDFTLGVSLGCCVGNGGSVSDSTGTGTYAADGYMADGYQARTGRTILVAGDVTLADYGASVVPNDDGVDFLSMGPAQAIQSIIVTNGPAAQSNALATHYADVAAATEALQAVATTVCLDLKPLTGGPFETEFPLTVGDLVVPKGIDLAAAA